MRYQTARSFFPSLHFGIQEGLISTVGHLSGIAAAVTGGLSMATGSYLSARTEKENFEKELLDEERLATDQPCLAQEALLEALTKEGLARQALYRIVQEASASSRPP